MARARQFDMCGDVGFLAAEIKAGAGASPLRIARRIFADRYEFTISLILATSWGLATVSGAPLKAMCAKP